MLLPFGVGLGGQISALKWAGSPIDYLSYHGDEDGRFDAFHFLMEDGAHGEVALDIFKGFPGGMLRSMSQIRRALP